MEKHCKTKVDKTPKKFKPMLAPNEDPDISNIAYPFLASYKLDGIRCIFKDGEILTRSLKQVKNKQLRERFQPIADYTKGTNIILDGEIYAHGMSFQDITHYVMTEDFESERSIKKNGGVQEIPEELKFYCFDQVVNENQKFSDRIFCMVLDVQERFPDLVVPLKQNYVYSKQDLTRLFDVAIKDGYEGLILKDPNGRYKFGRGTLKEGLIYKLKPFRTFDAKVIDVEQSTIVDPKAEKKINNLGRSETSRKKDDRILIDKASCFWVEFKGKKLKVALAMTDEEKVEIWANRASYIGKYIEYKGMLIGAKDVPRHPVFIRFREDK